MGIITVAIIIFLAFLVLALYIYESRDDGVDCIFCFVVGIALDFIFLFAAVPSDTSITNKDFVNALGAKAYIEGQSRLSQDNQRNVSQAFEIIESYNEKRKSIEKRSKSYWTQGLVSTRSIREYPEIIIDTLYINNLNYEGQVSPDDAE